MNSKQIKTAAAITSKIWIDNNVEKYINGELSWSATMIGDKLFLQGTNCETSTVFSKLVCVQFLIGSRGGLNKVKVI